MWFFILIIDGKGLKRRTHDRLKFLPCVLYAKKIQPAYLALLLFQEDQLAQVIGYMVGTVDHNVQLVAVWFF